MLELNMNVQAVDFDELVMSLEEALKQVKSEMRSGFDEREDKTGVYSFDITGEEAESIECPDCGDLNYIIDGETPDICFNCDCDLITENGE